MRRKSPRWRPFFMLGLLTLLGTGMADAARSVNLKIVRGAVPQSEASVVIYLSYGTETGKTGQDGAVTLETKCGRGFWVEVNGLRLSDFYLISDMEATATVIDLDRVGTIEWPGRQR